MECGWLTRILGVLLGLYSGTARLAVVSYRTGTYFLAPRSHKGDTILGQKAVLCLCQYINVKAD